MPNAARLAAAVSLAILAFILSGQIMPLMPEGTDFGYFTIINMSLGVLVGWILMGRRAGRGTVGAINNGFTGMVTLIFWGLFVQGAYEMFRRAMRNRYDGPFEAVAAIFEIGGIEYGQVLLNTTVITTAILGGIIAGLLTESAYKRWP